MKSHNGKKINNGMNFLLVEKVSKKKDKIHCFECGNLFANKHNFERHMQRKHCDDLKDEVNENDNDSNVLINCEHCPQKFSTFQKLMKHLEDAKAKENLSKCDVCETNDCHKLKMQI